MLNINSQHISQNRPYSQSFKQYNGYGSYQGTSSPTDGATKAAGYATFLQIIAMSLVTLSKYCSNMLMRGKECASEDIVKDIAKSMVAKNNLNITLGYVDEANKHLFEQKFNKKGLFDEVAKGRNAFFSNSLKLAVAPKSHPQLILHEIGHAINSTKGRVMKFLQNSRYKMASLPAVMLISNLFFPKSKKDGQTFIERHAGKIGFAAFLPTIIEEGLASLRGIKAAKAAKAVYGNKINLTPLKTNYLFAWTTYLISGLLLGISMKQVMLDNKK